MKFLDKLLFRNSNKRVIKAMLRILIPCTLLSWIGFAISFETAIILSLFGSGIYFTIIILYFSGRNSAVYLNLDNKVGILGQWELSPAEAEIFINKEVMRFGSKTKTIAILFFFIPSVLALIGFLPMSLPFAIALGAGIALFVMIFSWSYKKEISNSMKDDREIVVTMAGTKVGDVINDWSMSGRHLNAVTFSAEESSLVFTYYTTTRSGKNKRDIYLPFPSQFREKAEGISIQINRWLSGEEQMP